MSRAISVSCRYVLVAAVVLSLAGCTGHKAVPALSTTRSITPTPSPSLELGCGASACPTVSAPTGLFPGRLLTYATHGFTAAELAKVTAHVAGPVTAVYSSEQTLASNEPAYPMTPVATLLTDGPSYAAAVGEPALAGELDGGIVLAQTEAELRGATTGGTITLADNKVLPITAVVPDQVIGGYEMATSNQVLTTPATQPAAYLLVGGMSGVAALTAVMTAQLPGRSVRVRQTTANGFLSSYDTVLTQLEVKRRFGEFSIKQSSSGGFVPDSSWLAQWIRTVTVPQLGQVQCNKAILPDLIAAMKEVTSRGLGSIVHTADFQREGGCFNPRITRFSDGGSLSTHSWGIAVDINVDDNPLGAKPKQDPRLVSIMAAHGFTWGGRWLRPDGAHFEWTGTALAG
ncbi:MAG: hypothetical protein QOE76_3763 [Frankiales bacterium]|nr:hypothetical protein [Frankiales bacterium]